MLVPIPPDQMVPLPELFRHRSTLHGQAHVSRVMVHAMRLIDATGQHAYGPQLWASVFLHDLARTHEALFDATDGAIATGPAHFAQLLAVATRLS